VEDDRFFVEAQAGAESGKKKFGVIAGESGFMKDGFSVGLKGGEKKAGFNLGTGDGAGEVCGVELGAVNVERGAIVGAGAKNFGAEFTERVGNASHGSTREGGIAEKTSLKRLACDESSEEAHGGTTVSTIDGFGGGEELSSTAFDENFIGGDSVDTTTEGLKGMKSREAIFAWEKPAEASCT
jgi:hypothetical protein